VSFADLSTGSPTSWSWNLGDPGSGSANTRPSGTRAIPTVRRGRTRSR
jgi:PKD repeat protein